MFSCLNLTHIIKPHRKSPPPPHPTPPHPTPEKGVKYVQSEQKRHQNDINNVTDLVLVFLLLILSIFYVFLVFQLLNLSMYLSAGTLDLYFLFFSFYKSLNVVLKVPRLYVIRLASQINEVFFFFQSDTNTY